MKYGPTFQGDWPTGWGFHVVIYDNEAPVAAGQPLGEIKVSLSDEILLQEQLRALSDNPSGSLWQRAVEAEVGAQCRGLGFRQLG